MDLETKKHLASNWFKTLQHALCDDILKIEKNIDKALDQIKMTPTH